jgi:hypothetical protein
MVSQRRVTEQRHVSTELARIQAGGMESIGAYLDGIWNQSNNTGTRRDLYFNYIDKEISFVYDDIQEVYRWERSVVRRNGVYITAINAAVANLQRQIDLNLTGLGELSLRIQDDVRLNISESSLWDGSYRKVTEVAASEGATASASKQRAAFESLARVLLEKPAWKVPDGSLLHFGPAPSVITLDLPDGTTLRGRYALQSHPAGTILELRFDDPATATALSGTFSIEPASQNTRPPDDIGSPVLELQPVTLRPGTFTAKNTAPLRLE